MSTGTDDVLVRLGRWALAKVWFGVVVSGGWAIGQHYDWPRAFLSAAAVLGAVALAMASSFLPVWTRQRPSGIPVADVGLRVMVWGGLIIAVIALLIGMPAVGMVAAALLVNAAARTFGDPFAPLLRRLRATTPVHAGRARRHTAPVRHAPPVRHGPPSRAPASGRPPSPPRPEPGPRPASSPRPAPGPGPRPASSPRPGVPPRSESSLRAEASPRPAPSDVPVASSRSSASGR
ncbi:hypothetical protein [Actinoplanes sp. G11-F43]|uniref:hypothetical protein n=1 Tax=Actinoplanes sp. G11-F43 TaxID=3424130 RepID=UPI003D33AFD2